MGLKINFAEVENSFEPLPEGSYECIIEIVEVRESQSSENDYLNWELTVQSDVDGNEEFKGRKLWAITSLGKKALWKLKETLVNLEIIGEDDEIEIDWEEDIDITPKEGPRVINPELEGMACLAVVTNQVYEGRERNRVNEIRASGDAPAASGRPAKGSGGSSKKPAGRRRLR